MKYWYTELAKELESVVKGGEHEAKPETIQNLITDLKSGEMEEVQVAKRLRDMKLGWFAQRLDDDVFHARTK